jgi:hypothetical protein
MLMYNNTTRDCGILEDFARAILAEDAFASINSPDEPIYYLQLSFV